MQNSRSGSLRLVDFACRPRAHTHAVCPSPAAYPCPALPCLTPALPCLASPPLPAQRPLQVLSRQREGTPLGPGQCEFSLVNDSEAALTTGQWCVHTGAHTCLYARCCLLPSMCSALMDSLRQSVLFTLLWLSLPCRPYSAGCCRALMAPLWVARTRWWLC